MIPANYVSALKWDKQLGERLKSLRGRVTRRELALKVQESGQRCSHQYIQKLEIGSAESVSLDIVQAICSALEITLGHLIPTLLAQSPR
jgi:transcriptional regulator with XRE-family HTH domain